jgi:hypothetical protein
MTNEKKHTHKQEEKGEYCKKIKFFIFYFFRGGQLNKKFYLWGLKFLPLSNEYV